MSTLHAVYASPTGRGLHLTSPDLTPDASDPGTRYTKGHK